MPLRPCSFITPVVKTGLEVPSSEVAVHRAGPFQQPCTPLNQAPCFQTPQVQYYPPNRWVLFSTVPTVKDKPMFPLQLISKGCLVTRKGRVN